MKRHLGQRVRVTEPTERYKGSIYVKGVRRRVLQVATRCLPLCPVDKRNVSVNGIYRQVT